MNKYRNRFLTENEVRQLIESYCENKNNKKMVKKKILKHYKQTCLRWQTFFICNTIIGFLGFRGINLTDITNINFTKIYNYRPFGIISPPLSSSSHLSR